MSSAYTDLKDYIDCITKYSKYCKENPQATQDDLSDKRKELNETYKKLKQYIKESELEMPLNCDYSFFNAQNISLKDDFKEKFNQYTDKIHKLKQLAQKDDNKNLSAIWFINKIVLTSYDDDIDVGAEENDDFTQKLLRLKAIYTLLYGQYNDDLVIDALSKCNDYSVGLIRQDYDDDFEYKHIIGNCFDIYCAKKLAKLIEKNKTDKQGKTFVEKFFTYLNKSGIDKHLFAYLMRYTNAKKNIEDYALKNHVCMLFGEQLNVYAVSVPSDIDKIDGWKQDVEFENNRFRVIVNGWMAYCDTVARGCYGKGITIVLPYKFGEEKGEGRQKASNNYKALLAKIFNNKDSHIDIGGRDIYMYGISNGNFITADLVQYMTNNLNLNIKNLHFQIPPAHFPGPWGNLGMKNIQDVMNRVTDKSKVKSITVGTVSKDDHWAKRLVHPQRKARQLAQKMSDIGYEDVIFKKIIPALGYTNYQYVNNDNKDRIITQKISEFHNDRNEQRLYFRSNDDVLVVEKKYSSHIDRKLIYSIFKCSAQEVKNLAYDDKREKVVKKFNQNFNEECLCDYLRYFNDVVSVENDDGIDIEIAGKTYTYKFVKDNVYCLAESCKTAKDMEVPDDIIKEIGKVDKNQGVHKTHCMKLNDGRWFIHYQGEKENKDIGEDFKNYKENEKTKEDISICKGGSNEEKSNTNIKINTAENRQNQKYNADKMKENSSKNRDDTFMNTKNFLCNTQRIKPNTFSSELPYSSAIVNNSSVVNTSQLGKDPGNKK